MKCFYVTAVRAVSIPCCLEDGREINVIGWGRSDGQVGRVVSVFIERI